MLTTTPINRPLFLVGWILAALCSLFIAGAFFHYPSDFGSVYGARANISGAPFGFILGAVTGLLFGLPQWILLRRFIRQARRWLLTTSIGLGIIHSLGDAFPFAQYLIGATVLGAVVMSVMQRRLLRGVVTQPNMWLVASIAGWVLGYLLAMRLLTASGLLLRPWEPNLGALQHAVFGSVQGLVYALITGTALMWQRRESSPVAAVEQSNA